MNQNLIYKLGDIVKISPIAYGYQNYNLFIKCLKNKQQCLGVILYKNEFVKVDDPNDCQDISDGSCIQEPQWVYTILANGRKMKVLDVDVVSLVS